MSDNWDHNSALSDMTDVPDRAAGLRLSTQLIQGQTCPMPSIGSIQSSPNPSRVSKSYLPQRMWLVKLNASLNIKSCGSELPYRSIQFLRCKPCYSHGKEEVSPRNFSRQVVLRRVEKQGLENLKGTMFDSEHRLHVFNDLGSRFFYRI